MPKLITVTLNTAIDNIVQIENFKIGSVEKANSNLYQSGKGINVARAISSLKKPVTAIGFTGFKELNFFKELNSERIKLILCPIQGNTRMNTTLLNKQHRLIIHTRSSGYTLNKQNIETIFKIIKTTVKQNDVIIFSGSIPNKEVNSSYCRFIKYCSSIGAKTLLDSSGKELLHGIAGIPYAIKPNLDELREISGKKIASEKEIVRMAKRLNSKGIEFVFVSNGPKGIIACIKNHSGYWKAYLPEQVHKITGSEIGCGDAAVAAIAVSFADNKSIEDILRLSVATATANLFAKTPCTCDSKVIKKYASKVKLEKIDFD